MDVVIASHWESRGAVVLGLASSLVIAPGEHDGDGFQFMYDDEKSLVEKLK